MRLYGGKGGEYPGGVRDLISIQLDMTQDQRVRCGDETSGAAAGLFLCPDLSSLNGKFSGITAKNP